MSDTPREDPTDGEPVRNDPDPSFPDHPLAQAMSALGWPVDLQPVPDGPDTVIATVAGSGPGPTLLLVAGAEPLVLLQATKALSRQGFPGRIRIAVVASESAAAVLVGSDALAGVDAAVVYEPDGSPVGLAAAGAVSVSVVFHSGAEAAPAAARLVLGLTELAEQLTGRFPAHPLIGAVQLYPAGFSAGDGSDRVPDTSSVAVVARTVPGIGHAGLIHLVTRLAEQIAAESGLQTMVVTETDRPAAELAADHPAAAALAAAAGLITGSPTEPGLLGPIGAVLAGRVPTVGFHGAGEIADQVKILALTGRRFLNTPGPA